MKPLPDLHQKALIYKNKRKLQHDGGRAWIKNPQLHESIKGTSITLETVKKAPSEKK